MTAVSLGAMEKQPPVKTYNRSVHRSSTVVHPDFTVPDSAGRSVITEVFAGSTKRSTSVLLVECHKRWIWYVEGRWFDPHRPLRILKRLIVNFSVPITDEDQERAKPLTSRRDAVGLGGYGKPGTEDVLLASQADREGWYGKLKSAAAIAATRDRRKTSGLR